MSWEQISQKRYRCPCGEDHYIISILTDDWNRSEEQWVMHCKDCNDRYKLYSYTFPDNGAMLRDYVWVETNLLGEVNRVENEIKASKSKALHTARSKYLLKWLDFFKDLKSKKEIWRKLTDNGKSYPSYATMIGHLKRVDLKSYLQQQFYFDNLGRIFETLKIEDVDLEQLLTDIKHRQTLLIKSIEKLVKGGYR